MKRLIFTVMLLLPCLWLGAQSQRERELLNQDWLFAKGHAANPEKDFNYGQALYQLGSKPFPIPAHTVFGCTSAQLTVSFHLELLLAISQSHPPVMRQRDLLPLAVVKPLRMRNSQT